VRAALKSSFMSVAATVIAVVIVFLHNLFNFRSSYGCGYRDLIRVLVRVRFRGPGSTLSIHSLLEFRQTIGLPEDALRRCSNNFENS